MCLSALAVGPIISPTSPAIQPAPSALFFPYSCFSTSGLTALLISFIPSLQSEWIKFNDKSKIISGKLCPSLLFSICCLCIPFPSILILNFDVFPSVEGKGVFTMCCKRWRGDTCQHLLSFHVVPSSLTWLSLFFT